MFAGLDVWRTGCVQDRIVHERTDAITYGKGWMLETQEWKFKGLAEPEGGRTEGRQAIGER